MSKENNRSQQIPRTDSQNGSFTYLELARCKESDRASIFFCVIRGFPRTSSLPQVTSGVQQNTTVVCDEETYPNGGSTGSLLVVR